MRRSISFLFLFLLFLFTLISQTLAQTVATGSNSAAVIKGFVKFRNFSSGGGKELYVGTSDTTYMDRSDITYSSTNRIRLIYSGSTISGTVESPASKVLVYPASSFTSINYIEITVVGGQSQTTVAFNNVKINGSTFTGNNFPSPPNKIVNITGINLTSGCWVEGDLVLTGSQPGGDGNYVLIKVGSLITDTEAPVVTFIDAHPNYFEVGTDDTLEATISDTGKGNSNIASADYKIDSGNWIPFTGTFNSPTVSVTAILSGLTCGEHTLYVRGTDAIGNVSDVVSTTVTAYRKGSISGKVLVNSAGVGGVTVKLLYLNGSTWQEMDSEVSAPGGNPGYYGFTDILPSQYRLMIVVPLGYTCTPSDPEVDVEVPICDNDVTQDFTLTAMPIVNNARGKGYWKNQFDFYVDHRGKPQETQANLDLYIQRIATNYISHYSLIFDANVNYSYWATFLNYGGPDMWKKAAAHLATLVLNMASLKIAQSEVVTLDGRDVADVITTASEILSDPTSTLAQLEKAKNICESVNNQIKVAAGLVTDYNILYKDGTSEVPVEYSLSNYPNPFNPATVIKYSVARAGYVSLKVYDVLGNEVSSLVDETKEAGIYSINFNASNLSSGVYLYVIKTGNFYSAKKMLYMK